MNILLDTHMAACSNRLPVLLCGAFAFALRKPLKALVLLFFHIFPIALAYLDAQNMPLYAFFGLSSALARSPC